MKKTIFITIALFLSIQTFIGQEKSILNLITSGKWYLSTFENDGLKKTYSEELKEKNWMKFNTDGKHEVMSFGYLESGEWELSNNNKMIKMINNNRASIYEILTLNESQIILKREEEDTKFIMVLKKQL